VNLACRTLAFATFCLSLAAPVWADPPANPVLDAAVERFATCARTEGATVSDDDRALLRESLAPLVTTVGGVDCQASPDDCVRQLQATTCGALADLWRPSIAPAAARVTLAPWADTLASRQRDQTLACIAEQERRPATAEERETVDAWVNGLWGSWSQRPCSATAQQAQACAARLFGSDCAALGAALDAGALRSDLDEPAGDRGDDPCEPILACMGLGGPDLGAIDAERAK
jgi:hypothetical protein